MSRARTTLRTAGSVCVATGAVLGAAWVPAAGAAVTIPPAPSGAPTRPAGGPTAATSAATTAATGSPYDGWWSQLNQAPTPLPALAPANPSTPPDGIEVTTTAAGVVAIGAVRFTSVPSGSDTTLTLHVASGTASSASNDLVVHACPATNAWKPVQNGKWADRATYAETSCVTGTIAGDAKSVRFAIPASDMTNGNVDVVIEAMSSAPVTLSFSHPALSDLAIAAASAPMAAPPAAAPAQAPAAAPAPADTPVAEVPTDASPSSGPGLALPATPAVRTPAAPKKAASLVPQRSFLPASSVLPPLVDNRTTRILAVALLFAIGLSLFWFGSQPVRSPQLIGSLGTRMGGGGLPQRGPQDVRGIGRFARNRDGLPRPPR